jgi:hypothetical protein
MRSLSNIFWLGTKELRSFLHDYVLIGLVIYAFSLAVIMSARSNSQELHNASIAVADEDHSELSRRITHAFLPPLFQLPQTIAARDIVPLMNAGKFTFVVDIPANFERDVIGGRQPGIQVDVDATAMVQAGLGSGDAQQIITTEIADFLSDSEGVPLSTVNLVVRIAFNPNVTTAWFTSVMGIINNVTMLAIIMSGAAIIREREQGLGERPGDHGGGRPVALRGRAYDPWHSDRRLDPLVHGRCGDLSVLRDGHRHIFGHGDELDAATRVAVHAGLFAHEHAFRRQYAAGEHAVLAGDHHASLTINAFCFVRAVHPVSRCRHQRGLATVPDGGTHRRTFLRPRDLAFPHRGRSDDLTSRTK